MDIYNYNLTIVAEAVIIVVLAVILFVQNKRSESLKEEVEKGLSTNMQLQDQVDSLIELAHRMKNVKTKEGTGGELKPPKPRSNKKPL